MEIINAIRGMNDILPTDTALWQHVESILRNAAEQFGFQEIRFPIAEKTELFKRTIGEATDIVEKEMYTFLDRNEESLTLRPEGTAGCVRAGIEHGLFYNQIQRLWYMGPCFRYERPQKGRYRQFHHFGAEVFGLRGPDIDAELICLTANILDQLKLLPHTKLLINSMGSNEARKAYREKLVAYLKDHYDALDEDSQRRLATNPLRILDSKNLTTRAIIENAPKLKDHLGKEDEAHFLQLLSFLDQAGISYHIDSCLVRGLDYYTRTVFEWTTDALGAQGTVCGGGRYDGLIEQLGGKPTPALGFAIGLERIILLVQQIQTDFTQTAPDIYLMTENDTAFAKALALANTLREHFSVLLHCGGGPLKNQFKKADKTGAKVALVIGEKELSDKTVSLKLLRENLPQVTIPENQLIEFLVQKMIK